MASLNEVFLISLGIILLGFLLRKFDIASEENGKFLARLAFYVTLPAVIFTTITSMTISKEILAYPIIIWLFSLIVWGVTFLLVRNRPITEKGLFFITTIGFNVHNFAFPLVEGIWGLQGLHLIAMWGAGNTFIVFGFSYIIASILSPNSQSKMTSSMTETFSVAFKQLIKSLPLISLIVAVFVNLSGFQTPLIIEEFLSILARANSTIVLLLLGILFEIDLPKEKLKNINSILIIRYVFGLTIGIILFFILPFPHVFRVILLIGMVLPVGLSITTFAVEFGYDIESVTFLTNASILLSYFLISTLNCSNRRSLPSPSSFAPQVTPNYFG